DFSPHPCKLLGSFAPIKRIGAQDDRVGAFSASFELCRVVGPVILSPYFGRRTPAVRFFPSSVQTTKVLRPVKCVGAQDDRVGAFSASFELRRVVGPYKIVDAHRGRSLCKFSLL